MPNVESLLDDKYELVSTGRCTACYSSYLALDKRANKLWEIKIIPKLVQIGGSTVCQFISVDIDFLLRWNHPNLQHIIDLKEDSESYIVVEEAIEGQRLDEVIRDFGPQPDTIISLWARQMCDVLSYLHTKDPKNCCGYIDLSNFILQPNGKLVLADYFIETESISVHSDTLSLGTSSFILPVYNQSNPRDDIYSLGVMILSLCKGISYHPFHPELIQAASADCYCSDELQQIIIGCISTDRSKRYKSISDINYSLSAYSEKFCYRKRTKLHRLFDLFKPNRKTKGKSKKNFLSADDVQFSVLAPKRFKKGEYTIIDIFMYDNEHKDIVLVSNVDNLFGVTTSGFHHVEQGTSISIQLYSPDIEIEDNVETLTWNGKYLRFQFGVYLPEGYPKEQLFFTAHIYFNSVIVSTLKFEAQCVCPKKQMLHLDRIDYSSAFVSYASQDRKRVISIVQGMRKVRPDMEIFLDIDYLRSGDYWEDIIKDEICKRDILFLCWSASARNSAWVDMEWRYALQQKGLDGIEPIPLESPKKCPPPKELESMHFNDRALYYMFDEG